MNIYIATSVSASEDTKASLVKLAANLRKKGHKVNDTRLNVSLKDDEYNQEDLKKHYSEMINSIKHCDVMIAEISSKSSGLGYEIGLAISERKPTLALYTGDKRKASSLSLASNPSKKLSIENYTEATLEKTVEAFIQQAKDQIDTKFILIISPEIDKYLEWASVERRMHKAQIVRNAVEDIMGKDKEYQTHLKDSRLD